MPMDPGPCPWALPDPADALPGEDVVAVGADLQPATVLAGYAMGLFPMHLSMGDLAWWSPDPRGVLPLDALKVSRSLRRSMRAFTFSLDADFVGVMRSCAEGRTEGQWITEEFVDTYTRLHRLGWAHSIEVWQDDALVGGLYGIEIGGLFAGESMFHRVPDASKAALVVLVDRLRAGSGDAQERLLDVQWRTEHLASLGVIEISRSAYLSRLEGALRLPAALGG
ncbi:MAG TPA: leucyl/phenylalanyl-tRNA--protein transferase [Actinobacteria bacterium]|jgi:leucyl/phenylalanyl-tRNA---protein transferase|nr:leucyl/phenylalanyl-tRNA--protein transferase [Actinomycetota bacterium]